MRIASILLAASLATTLAGGLDASAAQSHAPIQRPSLMPMPAAVTWTGGRLPFDTGFTVAITRYRDGRLERGITRAVARLERRLGRPLSRRYGKEPGARLVVAVAGRGFAIPDLGENESYRLEVNDSQAVLTAATVVGALRGLETFLQLQTADARGRYIAGAIIDDTPRFRWRGLLLDVSRHFEPVNVIEHTLDGMAMVKLNVFHWHLSDDQGFRVESHRYPKLQELGSDSLFYTQDQIRHVVAYAADRGIRVMPEFDMPGHSSSWFVGYPDLTVGGDSFAIARGWGVFFPTMDPTRESTYHFLDRFIGEISQLFPDKYWHIGGDEVNARQWQESDAIQNWMKAHNIASETALQTEFNRRLFKLVKKHDRIPVGWNEIFQPGLPNDAVIQSWTGTDVLAASAKAGFRGILSAPYYIDHQALASTYYLADPIRATTGLTPEQQALILGGEACMWSEYATPLTIDSRIWPRLAAVAERFWSPQSVRDVSDMYRRLDAISNQLADLGLGHQDHIHRMAMRLAGDSFPLFESLLGFVRPRDFGGSGATQFFPHTALIDAAVADPEPSWDMVHRARQAVAGDAQAVHRLRDDFTAMTSFEARLLGVSASIPAAAEGLQVAGALGTLGRLGQQSLDYLGRGVTADSTWRAQAAAALDTVSPKHTGRWLLRPAPYDAVKVLVDAAAGLPPSPDQP